MRAPPFTFLHKSPIRWRCSRETCDRHRENSLRRRVRRETSGTTCGCPQRAIPAPIARKCPPFAISVPALYIEESLRPCAGPADQYPSGIMQRLLALSTNRSTSSSPLHPCQGARICVIVIRQKRGADRSRCPVNHDSVQSKLVSERSKRHVLTDIRAMPDWNNWNGLRGRKT